SFANVSVFFVDVSSAIAAKGALPQQSSVNNLGASQVKTGNVGGVRPSGLTFPNTPGTPDPSITMEPTSEPTSTPTNASSTATHTGTGTGTPIDTGTVTSSPTPSELVPPPTYTVSLPPPAPSLSPLPTGDYTDEAIDNE